MSIAEIQKMALTMNEEDRVELAASLLDSLDGADPNDAGQDSLTEARQRSEEWSSGKVQALTEDELMAEMRAMRSQ